MLAALALSGLTTFPVPVLGHTWIVDDDGGAGVDFTTIQAAIDAASPDDVLLVRPGNYLTFLLQKPLRLIGEGGPVVSGPLLVENLPAHGFAVVSGLRASSSAHVYRVTACAGTVVVEDSQATSIVVTGSSDVRVRGNVAVSTFGTSTLSVTDSRVEVVECTFRGFDGYDQICGWGYAGPGEPAARVHGGELHAARSSFRGGFGGSSTCWDLGLVFEGGDGGDGLVLWGSNSRALVTGVAANSIAGGAGGASFYWPGAPGAGVYALGPSSARVSGATIASTLAEGGATIATATPDDPTLRLLELPAPGMNLTFRLTAPAGSTAVMRIGGAAVVLPVGDLEEDVLVARAQSFAMGVVPAGEVLGFNFTIPAHWRRGTTVFAQATVTHPGGEVRRTHSVPLVVR